MLRSLVGSEMCVRDRPATDGHRLIHMLDRKGHCDEPSGHIVRFPKGRLKDLKLSCKSDLERRLLISGTAGENYLSPLYS